MKGGGKGVGSGEPGEVTIVGFTDESNIRTPDLVARNYK